MRKLHSAGAFLFLITTFSLTFIYFWNKEARSERNIASYEEGSFYPVEGDLSFEKLKEILSARKFNRISDLLSHLSESGYSEYLSHHTYAFSSESLHSSSPQRPRAIVYGKMGNFIITFNDDPKDLSHRMLEVVEFNREKRMFEFREIEFNEDRTAGRPPFLISEIGGPRSAEAPKGKCLSCHMGSKPIWESYPLWPGMYGEEDDAPFRAAKDAKRGVFSLAKPRHRLQDYWASFESYKGISDRYRFLGAFSQDNKAIIGKYRGTKYAADFSGPMPNSYLTKVLYTHNTQRMVRLLQQLPLSRKMTYGLMGVLQRSFAPENCENKPFIKKSLIEPVRQRMLANLTKRIKSIARNLEIDVEAEEYQIRKTAEDFEQKLNRSGVLAFFTILENEFPEAEIESWPLSVTPGIYNFNDGFDYHLGPIFLNALAEKYFGPNQNYEQLLWGMAYDCEGFRRSLPAGYLEPLSD